MPRPTGLGFLHVRSTVVSNNRSLGQKVRRTRQAQAEQERIIAEQQRQLDDLTIMASRTKATVNEMQEIDHDYQGWR